MSDAHAITLALGGQWHGSYELAFCLVHDNTLTPALTVGAGEGGRLLVNCKAGCDGRDVLAALRNLGISKKSGA